MESSVRRDYLATDVMTATPQKLQLALIEATIRSAQRARQKWQEQDYERACELLIHAQDIVGELLSGLNHEVQPELTRKVAAVYVFVFRRLMEANLERSQEKLDDALRVLQTERETWRQVCARLGGPRASDETSGLSLEA